MIHLFLNVFQVQSSSTFVINQRNRLNEMGTGGMCSCNVDFCLFLYLERRQIHWKSELSGF